MGNGRYSLVPAWEAYDSSAGRSATLSIKSEDLAVARKLLLPVDVLLSL
jgi:hypothetical protein